MIIMCGCFQADVEMFASTLLSPLGLHNYVAERSRKDRQQRPVSTEFPFVLGGHPASQAHVAQQIMHRLTVDAQYFAGRTLWLSCFRLAGFLAFASLLLAFVSHHVLPHSQRTVHRRSGEGVVAFELLSFLLSVHRFLLSVHRLTVNAQNFAGRGMALLLLVR
jgi:hypothetical protein